MRASVVIPTYRHFATLPYAVKSVQNQGVEDIEILIVGDGVDDATRAAVQVLQADDPRIRFFDLPKGPRRGELNRDRVLHEAQGPIVCYACDDVLWLPGHLQAMEKALHDADFVGAMDLWSNPTVGFGLGISTSTPQNSSSLGWSGNTIGSASGPTTASACRTARIAATPTFAFRN